MEAVVYFCSRTMHPEKVIYSKANEADLITKLTKFIVGCIIHV